MHLPTQDELTPEHFDRMREHFRSTMKLVSGIDDITGIELASQIRVLANLYDAVLGQNAEDGELSGPRWAVLMRLFGEEKQGNQHGLTPTSLSRSQRVSKNTISALLRGLEEQGLIQRELDSADLRIFRIQLTQAGRRLVESTAPAHLIYLNKMASALSLEERCQLNALLEKLHYSLRAACHIPEKKPYGG